MIEIRLKSQEDKKRGRAGDPVKAYMSGIYRCVILIPPNAPLTVMVK
jgi:hypothetical protein